MMFKTMRAFRLNDPIVDTSEMTVSFHIGAEVCDMADQTIVDAVVDAAQKAGITELYLLDKDFISDAIREKLAKMVGGAE